MDSSGLVIGPGFQQWITDHQATPLSDELPLNREMQMMMAQVADTDGTPLRGMLFYNKLINQVDWAPFVKATQ